MILGDVCTRRCSFCSVHAGKPTFSEQKFESEAERVVEAANSLGLKHVVVTSVARDDLEDGGASGFVATINGLRRGAAGVTIEVLIPDLRGDSAALQKIVDAGPHVLNHNLETVPRLYRKVRPSAVYGRSLELLQRVKEMNPDILTKTGIMLGLGENEDEVESVMRDAKGVDVDIFTAGQYLQPTRDKLDVVEYLPDDKFKLYETRARAIGFARAFIGPLVRSSYHAEEFVDVRGIAL
jgi:lipoic acid synthetase